MIEDCHTEVLSLDFRTHWKYHYCLSTSLFRPCISRQMFKNMTNKLFLVQIEISNTNGVYKMKGNLTNIICYTRNKKDQKLLLRHKHNYNFFNPHQIEIRAKLALIKKRTLKGANPRDSTDCSIFKLHVLFITL